MAVAALRNSLAKSPSKIFSVYERYRRVFDFGRLWDSVKVSERIVKRNVHIFGHKPVLNARGTFVLVCVFMNIFILIILFV